MVIHTPMSRTGYTGVTTRILLTALGAAGLIVGAFLNWTRDTQGTHLSWRALYQSTFGSTNDFVQTMGALAILVGLVALLGLADSTGWLTRLAGAVGIVGSVLFIIQVQRSSDHNLQVGLWVALVGSVLCVFAGFGGARGTVVVDE